MNLDTVDAFIIMITGLSIVLQVVIWVFALTICIGTWGFTIICRWKIYQKAGYEGWEAIIPFYSEYILAEITMGNGFWFFLSLIPFVGIFLYWFMYYRLGVAFQKDVGFTVGLVLVPMVFLAILAFSKENTYHKLPPI